MSIPSFPKVFRLGDRNIPDIAKAGQIEITEKVDGSSFGFGLDEFGELVMRSRGSIIDSKNPQKLFNSVIAYVLDNWKTWRDSRVLVPNTYVFGETLWRPKHNTLSYESVPKNHLAVFGLFTPAAGWMNEHADLALIADRLGFDVVPLLFTGRADEYTADMSKALLDTDSFLGKEKIEGYVIRNVSSAMTYFGSQEAFWQLGKHVREGFKERNDKSQAEGEFGQPMPKVEIVINRYRSEARWTKAVQRLRDEGKIEGRMQDMPKILDEIKRDLLEEEADNIAHELFDAVKGPLLRTATRGVGGWYSEYLAKSALADLPVEDKAAIDAIIAEAEVEDHMEAAVAALHGREDV